MGSRQANSRYSGEDDDNGIELNQNIQNADPEEIATEATEAMRVTTITDLNDHCLERIFMHLDLQSLFDVANANKWLKISAASAYGRKFGTNPVNLCSLQLVCRLFICLTSTFVLPV